MAKLIHDTLNVFGTFDLQNFHTMNVCVWISRYRSMGANFQDEIQTVQAHAGTLLTPSVMQVYVKNLRHGTNLLLEI